MACLAQYRLPHLPILLAICGLFIFSACEGREANQFDNDSTASISSSSTSADSLPIDLYFVELSVAMKWNQELSIRTEDATFALIASSADEAAVGGYMFKFYNDLERVTSDLLRDLEAILPPAIVASEHDKLQEVVSERIRLFSRIASIIERNDNSEEGRSETQMLITGEEQLNIKYHDVCLTLQDIAISDEVPITLPC